MGFLESWVAFNWLNRKINRTQFRVQKLEAKMATFEEIVSDLYNVTDNIADRIESAERVNAQLRQAVEVNDLQRATALSNQAAEHASVLSTAVERLRALGQDTSNPVPDTSDVPAADETVPASGSPLPSGPTSEPETPAPTTNAAVDAAAETPEVPETTADGTPVVVTASETDGTAAQETNGSAPAPGPVATSDTSDPQTA